MPRLPWRPRKPGDAERTPRLFWRNPAGEWRATGAKGDGLKVLKEHLGRVASVSRRVQGPRWTSHIRDLEAARPLRASSFRLDRPSFDHFELGFESFDGFKCCTGGFQSRLHRARGETEIETIEKRMKAHSRSQ